MILGKSFSTSIGTTIHEPARTETKMQVKGYPRSDFKGFTREEGGRAAAETTYDDYVRRNIVENVVDGASEDQTQNWDIK